MPKHSAKQQRQAALLEKLKQDPFLTDEELSGLFGVSIPTIRFDRAELGVAQYRERVKSMARRAVAAKDGGAEPAGEVLDLNVMKDGVSVFVPDESMTFPDSSIVRGCHIYAFAEAMAVAVIGANAALVEVANIKYKQPVAAGSKLFAKSEVVRIKDNEYIVWVKIKFQMNEVFRSKFILSAVD